MKKEITLELSAEMIKVIGVALGEIPTRIGMPVALEINRQIDAQHGEQVSKVD